MSQSERQQRRQSTDFKEIWNVQTEMSVKKEKWDQIMHNWDSPKNCKQNKLVEGCSVCDELRKSGIIKRTSTGETYEFNNFSV